LFHLSKNCVTIRAKNDIGIYSSMSFLESGDNSAFTRGKERQPLGMALRCAKKHYKCPVAPPTGTIC